MISKERSADSQSSENKKKLDDHKIQKWQSAKATKEFVIVDMEEFISQIRGNDINSYFIEMRKCINEYYETGDEGFKIKYDGMKAQLPLISTTSLMYPKRADINIVEYTGLIVLDLDDKDNEHLRGRYDVVKQSVSNNLYTNMAFYSPKGEDYGLKIIVQVKLPQAIKDINLRLKEEISDEERKLLIDKLKDFHKTAYTLVESYYSTMYGLNIDKCASNIQGGTYISADATAYYNPDSSCFEIVWVYCPKPKVVRKEHWNSDAIIPNSQIMDSVVGKFLKGNTTGRNYTVFQLAMQVKYYGVSQEEVVLYALHRWGDSDFNEAEIRRAVNNGFKKEYTPKNQYIINNENNKKIA